MAAGFDSDVPRPGGGGGGGGGGAPEDSDFKFGSDTASGSDGTAAGGGFEALD